MREPPRAVEWSTPLDAVKILDQRLLPQHETYNVETHAESVVDHIRTLAVRGAPAIGLAGAYGVVLAATWEPKRLEELVTTLREARPTARNLAWAVDRTAAAARVGGANAALEEARKIEDEDRQACLAMAAHGQQFLPRSTNTLNVMTICHTGAFCTAGIGTALGVVRRAHELGREVHVWVLETRPLLQGARLTAWELGLLGIERTLVVDSAAATLMRQGHVDVVLTGADRIARNGDVVNKVGTYALACHAIRHDVPFLVVVPTSTLDASIRTGWEIPIEERDALEVELRDLPAHAASDTPVHNPAFDVTPANLVTEVITEHGAYLR